VTARNIYRVKEVSRLAGVSIRTLHYYEEIRLLVPGGRTEAGYRLYTDGDLLRLQQILIHRELGLSLEEIRRSLDDPAFKLKDALLAQRKQLEARAERTAAMIAAVDAALGVMDSKGGAMEKVFGGFDPVRYGAEVQQRWGSRTDAYQESARRTRCYTKEDWARHNAEQEAIYRDAAALMSAGKDPTEADARAIAERHRLFIDRWFYACNHATHRGLASLYESDPRFAAGMDAHAAG
jgi:DNA-binding transcriptional MerR regulator